MKAINALCGQNTKLFIVKAGGTYSYYCASKFNLYICIGLGAPT
jgi:hypothetical protein